MARHSAPAGWWRAALALAIAAPATAATAQPPPSNVVTSPAPASTSVTIYRGPHESPASRIAPAWPQGYALITETRDVTIPAGRATLRFEGVAGGMLPESAIVGGLPAGVSEKNLDADLLSPRNLYARGQGRPVILRRTLPRTGKMSEEPAIIRSAPDGGVIVQTAHGYEAANCGGFRDALVWPALPPGLTPRPTLSVETEAATAEHVRLTLSYLAWGFDWQSHYVLALLPDGRHADMTAWVTLASGDTTSFADTAAAVVGGKPNFDEQRDVKPDDAGELVFHCFVAPLASTVAPPPPMMAMMASAPRAAMDMVVTLRKAVTLTQEALGDLKLYRVPMPTTLAAHAQKQVALFDHRSVSVSPYYKALIGGTGEGQATVALRSRNRKAEGLGLALPAGRVTVLEPHGGHMIPLGEASLADKAVGEMVELAVAPSPQVHVSRIMLERFPVRWNHLTTQKTRKTKNLERFPDPVRSGNALAHAGHWQDYAVTVSNANRWPIAFEGQLPADGGQRIASPTAPLTRKDGGWQWAVTVPANARATLRYRLERFPRSSQIGKHSTA